MSPNIYILSGPVQSGKTTALMEFWERGVTSLDGFLTPDIDESRKLIFLDTDEELPFELNKEDATNAIKIGRFSFSTKTFEKAKQKLLQLHLSKANLIIIDELGKLEMEDKGFEPELKEYILNFRKKNSQQVLILVIRNTLLNAAIEKYQLEDANVLSLNLFIEKFLDT